MALEQSTLALEKPTDYGTFSVPSYGGSMSPTFRFEHNPLFKVDEFKAPTFEEAYNEPGYQFRLQGGLDALQRSAAAKGLLRTGGTLKDIQDYGQGAATQEYANVFNRQLQGWGTKFETAKTAHESAMQAWLFRQQAEKERAFSQFGREWDIHQGGVNSALAKERMIQDALSAPAPVLNG